MGAYMTSPRPSKDAIPPILAMLLPYGYVLRTLVLRSSLPYMNAPWPSPLCAFHHDNADHRAQAVSAVLPLQQNGPSNRQRRTQARGMPLRRQRPAHGLRGTANVG